MIDYLQYWEQAVNILKTRMKELEYELWIKPLEPLNIDGGTLILKAESNTQRDTITSANYTEQIENALKYVNKGEPIKIKLILSEEELEYTVKPREKREFPLQTKLPNGLIPRFTFDNFIEAKSNQLAYAAAMAVSKELNSGYNPLFLYGGVGLGKTHLMHAIGNRVMEKNPMAKVLYVSCETFTNELISAIRDKNNNGNEKFRQKYREIDLLLIDDIQFISDKTGTQEEFFFTFNDLWENGKQIVITSDRHPSNIQKLTDRLTSRLIAGMTIDISLPDVETKIAILQEKAESQGVKLDDDVLRYIAEAVTSIREMEGALTTVMAYRKLMNLSHETVNMDMAMIALKDKVGSTRPEITLDYIQSVVGNYFNFSKEDLCSKRKTKDLALARQIAMYMCRKLLDETLVNIGKSFGGKDHSTVMHAIELVGKKMEESKEFEVRVADLERIITGK